MILKKPKFNIGQWVLFSNLYNLDGENFVDYQLSQIVGITYDFSIQLDPFLYDLKSLQPIQEENFEKISFDCIKEITDEYLILELLTIIETLKCSNS